MQFDLFLELNNATRSAPGKSKTGRDISIGLVSGTKLEILREIEPKKMGSSKKSERYVLARCECGIEKEIQLKHLRNRDINLLAQVWYLQEIQKKPKKEIIKLR